MPGQLTKNQKVAQTVEAAFSGLQGGAGTPEMYPACDPANRSRMPFKSPGIFGKVTIKTNDMVSH